MEYKVNVVVTKKGQKRLCIVDEQKNVIWLNYGLVKYVIDKHEKEGK